MSVVAIEFDRTRSYKQFAITTAILLSIVFATQFTNTNLSPLFDREGIANASELAFSLLHPDLSPDFVQRIILLAFESLYIGVLGTVIGAFLGILLAVISARVAELPDSPGKKNLISYSIFSCIQTGARFILIFFRAIPDIIWAYLFVMLLGLGAGPAVFAIALASCGIIGKLFAELAEAVDVRLVHASLSSGMSKWGIWWHCIFPLVQRQWLAYALFRMECNIRSGTILGVVGAGGLGSEIALSIRYFEYDKLSTALIAILIFVTALELVSALLRNRPTRWSLLFFSFMFLVSIFSLDIPWNVFVSFPQSLNMNLGSIAITWQSIVDAFQLSFETILMAWCATLLAAIFAFLIAPLATHQLITGSYVKNIHIRKGVEWLKSWFSLSFARFLLQLFRAMPELVYALIFVIWVGPGVLAGILAVAAHTFGVLGRLYTDVYEEVEHASPGALQSAGVSNLGVWLFGVLPQVFPRLLAFTLYRFEVNVRVTATVGFVGAGGIGDALHTAISLFHFSDLIILISALITTVICLDKIGSNIRLRLLRKSHSTDQPAFAGSKIVSEST